MSFLKKIFERKNEHEKTSQAGWSERYVNDGTDTHERAPVKSVLKKEIPQSSSKQATSFIEFDKGKVLGTGCLETVVYRGTIHSKPVAVKVLRKEFLGAHKDETLREIELLPKLMQAHENVVEYFGVEDKPDEVIIALELCDTTLGHLVTQKNGTFKKPNVLWQMTRGLAHLHSIGIIHRDLKPENILIKVDSVGGHDKVFVKISDFGLAKWVDNKSSFTQSSKFGTSGWYAPEALRCFEEALQSEGSLTKAIDIFVLAILFHYVLTGGKHLFGDSIWTRDHNILTGDHVEEAGQLRDLGIRDDMISGDPGARPNAQAVLDTHSMFVPTQRLFVAVDSGNLERVRIVCGAFNEFSYHNVSEIREEWNGEVQTVLHVGITRGAVSVVKYLIKFQGFGELLKQNGIPDVVETCVRKSTNFNSKNLEKRIAILQLLVKVQPEAIQLDRQRPGLQFSKRFVHVRLLIEVVNLGMDLNATDAIGDTILLGAATTLSRKNFHEFVCFILEREKSHPEHKKSLLLTADRAGNSVLHRAVKRIEPLPETLQLFKEQGLDFNNNKSSVPWQPGSSLFIWSVRHNCSNNFLKQLIELGADYTLPDSFGYAPIHWAAESLSEETLQFLLDQGADVNTRNLEDGCTPLHRALGGDGNTEKSRVSMAKLLIEKGADVNALNNNNHTPMEYYMLETREYNLEILSLLKKHGDAMTDLIKTWHGLTTKVLKNVKK